MLVGEVALMNFRNTQNDAGASRGKTIIFIIIVIAAICLFVYYNSHKGEPRAVPMRTDIKQKVIILGFDGMDSDLTEKWLNEGNLPNFARLRDLGCFYPLMSSNPCESPVSWSSLCSGLNPGDTNIYDFLRRDYSYHILPSWAKKENGKYLFNLIPYKLPRITNMRDGDMIWQITTRNGIPTTMLQAPITFPVDKIPGGKLTPGLGVPDEKGTQGTFSFYVDDLSVLSSYTQALAKAGRGTEFGGQTIQVTILPGDVVDDYILGPSSPITGEDVKVEFEVQFNRTEKTAKITIQEVEQTLKEGEWSNWWIVKFQLTRLMSVNGIFKMKMLEIPGTDENGKPTGNFRLYMNPINFDPKLPPPTIDLSYPKSLSKQLVDEIQDYYYTQGWPEETWAYNEELIDTSSFLEQVNQVETRRENIAFNELGKKDWNLFFAIFQATDRMQHMFFRLLDETHPRYDPEQAAIWHDTILESYQRADAFIGRVMDEYVDENTILIVVSDHGFNSFRRAVNLNRMLINAGLMTVKPEFQATNERILEDLFEGDSGQFFSYVDWSKTKAYALGLGQIYLNLKEREVQGIVEPGAEEDKVKGEIRSLLLSKTDPEYNNVPIIVDVYEGKKIYHGKHMDQAPDLVIGFAEGYRVSWQTCLGGAPLDEIEFNDRLWSGDHCSFDPSTTKGIFLSNRPIGVNNPSLFDVAPTIYEIFGIKDSDNLVGKSLKLAEKSNPVKKPPVAADENAGDEDTSATDETGETD